MKWFLLFHDRIERRMVEMFEQTPMDGIFVLDISN
jgi:hypothetical protein